MIRHGQASPHLAIMLLRETAALAIDTADAAPGREERRQWPRACAAKRQETSPSTSWNCRHLDASPAASHHRKPKTP